MEPKLFRWLICVKQVMTTTIWRMRISLKISSRRTKHQGKSEYQIDKPMYGIEWKWDVCDEFETMHPITACGHKVA